MTNLTQTVREIALEQPHSIRVFERFGIDYCCGGRKPLAEACAEKQIAMDEVVAALEAAAGSSAPLPVDWSQATLGKLIDHIVATHHAYVKTELPRLAVLAQKVVNRHGDTQAHLPAMQKFAGTAGRRTDSSSGEGRACAVSLHCQAGGGPAFRRGASGGVLWDD